MGAIDAGPGELWTRRDGGRARVYAVYGCGDYPIHGAYEVNKEWVIHAWTAGGRYSILDAEDPRDIIRKLDWRVELTPIWAALKPKYQWIAMDADRQWRAYFIEPKIKHLHWGYAECPTYPRTDISALVTPVPDCPWHETLTERPVSGLVS